MPSSTRCCIRSSSRSSFGATDQAIRWVGGSESLIEEPKTESGTPTESISVGKVRIL